MSQVYVNSFTSIPKHLSQVAGTQFIDRHWRSLKEFIGKTFPRKLKGTFGSKLHPEIDTLIKQWLYIQKFGTWRQSYRSVSKFNSRPAKLVIKRNEHLQSLTHKTLQKQSSFSQDLKGSKNGRKQKNLRKHREGELATVEKTGGVLSAAFHVVGT